MHQSNSYTVVTVVIGKDWTSGNTYGSGTSASGAGSSGTSSPAVAVASSAPDSSLTNNAADDKACMYVPSPEWR